MKISKQILYGTILALCLVAVLGTIKFFQISAAIAEGAKHGPPPSAISTVIVSEQAWQQLKETVAQVHSINGAVLSAETDGRVDKVHVADGANVKKGDLLVSLDDTVEKASYESARVEAEMLYKTYERKKALFDKKAISADDFDKAQLSFRSSKLQAESLKASWERKFIRAPFDGVVGVRRVNAGEYVKIGEPIIPLHDVSQLYVDFDVSQKDGPTIKVDDKIVYPGLELKVLAIDAAATGLGKTYRVRSNNFASSEIRPGEFIRISYSVGATQNRIVIPTSSISYAPYGDSVYVVEKKDQKTKVNPKFVKIFSQRGDFTAIESGLASGDEVATSGVFKLRPGADVIINNSNPINNELNPNPSNS